MFGFDTLALSIIAIAALREIFMRLRTAQDAPAGN
jgi:hypothetical protein